MITRKTSSILSHSSHSPHSRSSTPTPPEEWDADDEGQTDTMSSEDSTPSRPLSVTIPRNTGVRRPTLKEILANASPPPWSLTAFMAYLSNNHCLETLEFTMDAGRYKKHYTKMMTKAQGRGSLSQKDADNIKTLWQRLIEAYIKPNGSREVNLPSEVRDPILNLDYSTVPPVPEVLDPAVSKIYELMEDSVLVPFLNSVSPQTAIPTSHISHTYSNTSDENISTTAQTYDERSKSRWSRTGRTSPPPSSIEPHASTYSTSPSHLNRKSAPSTLSTSLNRHRFSTMLSPTSSAASATPVSATTSKTQNSDAGQGFPGLTDDSGNTSSPSNESPMTPPTSPPAGDISTSARSHRESGAWKKLGRLSQWKSGGKKSQNLKEGES